MSWQDTLALRAPIASSTRGCATSAAPRKRACRLLRRANCGRCLTVGDPSTLSWKELLLRIRRLWPYSPPIAVASVDVTRLRRQGARALRPELAFVTADGISAEVDRIGYLPPGLDRLLRTPETD